MGRTQVVSFKASAVMQQRLDELAKTRGMNRSQAIKAAIVAASDGGSGVPDEDEVLELLGEAARAGSVAAMKELRVYHRQRRSESDEGAELDPLAGVDQLATKRQQRAS